MALCGFEIELGGGLGCFGVVWAVWGLSMDRNFQTGSGQVKQKYF